MANGSRSMRMVTVTGWAMSGAKLSDEDAVKLERLLDDNPRDLKARTLLLGKYSSCRFNSAEQARLRLRHICWIAENQPQDYIAGSPYTQMDHKDEQYEQVKTIWLKQVKIKKNNPAVLENAANFFLLHENELAEQMLLKAINLRPKNRRLKHELVHLYSLWDGHEEQALSELEALCQCEDSEDLLHDLTDMPEVAFAAGQLGKARCSAERLLALSSKYRTNWNYGNAVNAAHTVLGRVALNDGNIEAAKRHLRESAIDIATPQTQSFGPSLDLANELFEAGERTAVLEYLDQFDRLCGVHNQWAFELRYKAEYGVDGDFAYGDCEKYLEAFRNHQLLVLRDRGFPNRERELVRLIRQLKRDIERNMLKLKELDIGGDAEKAARLRCSLEKEMVHLRRLEDLQGGMQ